MALGSIIGSVAAPRFPSAPYGGLPLYGTPSSAPAPITYPGFIPPVVSGSYQAPASVAAAFKSPATSSGGVDYTKQLADDATLQAALKQISDQGLTDTAQLTAARQTALARYGEIPANLSGGAAGDVNADVNQTTRDLAAEATKGGVSTVAQIAEAYRRQQAADVNNLAAHGLIRSGDLGYRTNLNLQGYQTAGYNAQNSLLDYLTQQYQGFLGSQAQGRSAAADATNQALSRIIAQIQAGLIGGGKNAAPTGGSSGGGDSGGGGGSILDALNPNATSGISAYSPGYEPSNYIPEQPITPTNFYTDVSLGAQQQAPPSSNNYGGTAPLTPGQIRARNRRNE